MDPDGFFWLIVRGGKGLSTSYDGRTLTVQFHKSPVAAGDPTIYRHMPFGSGAWVDRPINDAEPAVVRQDADRQTADSVKSVLRINDRFWRFLCANTNNGFFQVHRSEPAFMQVKID